MRYLKAGVGFLVAAFLMPSTSADVSSEGGPALSGDSLPALDDIGDVSIDMWQHTYEPLANWTQARIDEFTADHPNVSVDFQSVPFAQYQDKLFTAIAAGNAPTFFEVNDWSMTQFVEAGVLAPLDPVALGFESLEAMRADYEGTALDGAIVDGVLYGSPYDWTAPVLGVFNELLDANGVDPSTLTTWEATLAAAALMSEEDGDGNLVTSGLSFVHANDNYYKHQGNTLFRQAGAQLLTDDGTAAAINSPEAKRVFEFWRDAVHTEHVTDPGFTSTFYTNEFGEGRVATGFMLTWANSILVPFEFTFGEDYDILPLPTFEGGGDQLAAVFVELDAERRRHHPKRRPRRMRSSPICRRTAQVCSPRQVSSCRGRAGTNRRPRTCRHSTQPFAKRSSRASRSSVTRAITKSGSR